MQSELIEFFKETSSLAPGNIAYIEELYDQYLKNPASVPTSWKVFFDQLPKTARNGAAEPILGDIREKFLALGQNNFKTTGVASQTGTAPASLDQLQSYFKLEQLIQAYRAWGHFQAKLDPLELAPHKPIKQLNLEFYGFNASDSNQTVPANSFAAQNQSLKSLLDSLKNTYCNSLGFEYQHISEHDQVAWLQQRIEQNHARAEHSSEQKQKILKALIWAEEFERYLSAKYVGQTRFSLEGGCSLIPMLNELIQRAGTHGVKELVIGMGHRGRLSVLVNVLGKPIEALFQEFAKKPANGQNNLSGDVKYHAGFSANIPTEGGLLHSVLAFNPSHLEIINPVVEGSVRARQERRGDTERAQVIPVLIHGDAAFTGQGVVMETFNFSQTRGYSTGGTVHIIVNNQIGFTTNNPHDARSGWYSSDIAKMIEAPVFHVNADDPEAVVFATQLALDFRMQFKKDVVIDLVCYRRLGHNEADEPNATQPLIYQKIKQYPRSWELYLQKLEAEKISSQAEAEKWIQDYRKTLDDMGTLIKTVPNEQTPEVLANWKPYLNQSWRTETNTAISPQELQELGQKLTSLPENFVLQTQVGKEYENRKEMLAGTQNFNWGFAEALAYASLVKHQYGIRLSGQDCGRGTFAHRHAVLHDQPTDKVYLPLQNISTDQAKFTVIDSTLSEESVLGFEYGFATADPETLVIWEAQYGDFVNGAQVVIDQFITSGEQKWSRLCGLAMFLPHGYEGAGPEHSSARPERFLQACAQYNIQVCIPSTPAQMFHMIRRQMLRPYRKPLIVMTPKSLLRNKLSSSTLDEFTRGSFQLIIPEIDEIQVKSCKKVILCSGKVYFDLLKQRREQNKAQIAIIRIEQLYPFPSDELKVELEKYSQTKAIFWCQEEPQNQGAWYSIHHHLQECLAKGQTLGYIGRPHSASPATGYAGIHLEEQAKLVDEALSV